MPVNQKYQKADQIIREGLKNLQVSYSEADWEIMEKYLNEIPKSRSIKIPKVYLNSALIIILVCAGGYFAYPLIQRKIKEIKSAPAPSDTTQVADKKTIEKADTLLIVPAKEKPMQNLAVADSAIADTLKQEELTAEVKEVKDEEKKPSDTERKRRKRKKKEQTEKPAEEGEQQPSEDILIKKDNPIPFVNEEEQNKEKQVKVPLKVTDGATNPDAPKTEDGAPE